MATVHPSRMALVPPDSSFSSQNRSRNDRSPSPRRPRRSPTPPRDRNGRDRDRGGDRDGGRGEHRERDRDRGRERDRDRHRDDDRDYDRGKDGRRDRNSSRERDRDRNGRDANRRASPEYDDYKRPQPSEDSGAPWRRPENMYPNRRDRDLPPHNDGGHRDRRGGESGGDFLESRRMQRESATVDIWPRSPKAPARSLSPPGGHRSSKKSKRRRSDSPSDTDSSDEERRRRERKERKRRKAKEKEERREKKRSRRQSRSRSRSYDDYSEDDRRESRRKRQSRTRSPDRRRSPSRTRSPLPNDNDEDQWVVKSPTGAVSMLPPPVPARNELSSRDQDDSDDELGPQPVIRISNSSKRIDERAYGGQLLRGEGSAMAAFLQEGTESRIPRRGEIGLTSDEIAQYENVGYVMSGSRHRRMNAVRMRKENQVISAEEKRGILKLQKEERARREAILREEFSELVQESLKQAGPPKP
ncbi:hypothetical protein VKT23_001270 [Stygiomarasmius scandens]|uniref:NF-kappa-B-activating protein C-terminal domain-containing protein n=1 Tax=Marasmiellus scandens TaxID=2682957 RepID=A0ABR1K6L6_9AGAR